jgi:phosphate butyryltransferase
VALLEAAALARVLVMSDGFVNPRPDIRTRLAIIGNCLSVCQAIGISAPRVALLAAVEQVYPGMPVTVESAEIANICKAGETKRAHVDGPLSFDVALVEQVAKEKGATGEVAGNADVLVGSSIEVINGIYMAQTVLARANAASVVVGGKAPLALPFPSDCVDNIFFSICLACLLSRHDPPSAD